MPHHIVQRGNRRQDVFFKDSDYKLYIDLMAEKTEKYGVEIWCYCLMTNHVHLVAVPKTADGLSKAIGEAHKEYTRFINTREKWGGYLWQGRFSSFVMDERYFLASCRYIENNPVKAKIVDSAFDYALSSAKAHLDGIDDSLVKAAPALSYVGNWAEFLNIRDEEQDKDIEKHSRTGRPLGSAGFLEGLQEKLGIDFTPKKAGRKPKEK